ncbi:MAG: hypothetical protein ACRDPW_02055, partial [Mycobacteriales bacterium]
MNQSRPGTARWKTYDVAVRQKHFVRGRRQPKPVSYEFMVATDDSFDPLGESHYRPSFDVVLRGYDRHQVAEALSDAEVEAASLRQERELAYERLTQYTDQIERLQRDVYTLNQHLKEAESLKAPDRAAVTAQVQEILSLAETEADHIRTKAVSDAGTVRTTADEVLSRARLKSEQLLEAARVCSKELTATATREAAETTTQARTTAEGAVTAAQSEAAITAEQLVAQAQRRAEQIVAKA